MTTKFAGVCMGIIFFISGFGTDQVCFSNTLSESHEAASLTDVVYQVDWGYRSNVTLNEDNSMTKSGASAWDAGGASNNKLNSGADGWMEFTLGQVAGFYVLGLSKAKTSLTINSILYGFYVNGNGAINIYENGSNKLQIGTVQAGDILKVARENGIIKYYRNGVMVRSVSTTTAELLIDVSLYAGTIPAVTCSFSPLRIKGQLAQPTPGINDGSIVIESVGGTTPYSYNWNSTEATSSISGKSRGAYTVTVTDVDGATDSRTYNLGYKTDWSYRSNVTINPDNSMTKVGSAVAWDAGGSSTNKMNANTDGWIEIVVNNLNGSTYAFGLSRAKTSLLSTTISYGFLVQWIGVITIYENGSTRGQIGILREGDILRIGREGGTIKYYHNEVMVRSITATTAELSVDASLHTGTIPAVICSFSPLRIQGQVTPPNPGSSDGSIVTEPVGGATPYSYNWSSAETTSSISGKTHGAYTVTVTDADGSTGSRTYEFGYKTDWSYRSNLTLNPDNSLTKTTASSSWNAGGSSSNKLDAGIDGWIEIVANNVTGSTYAFGLSQAKESLGLSSIGYGFYITSSGTISVYEQGSNKGQMGTLNQGDILRVSREGGTIKYYHNGVIIRTVSATTSELLIDLSMHSGTIPAITCSFSPLRIKGQLNPPSSGSGASDGSIVLELIGGAAPYSYSWTSAETISSIVNKTRSSYGVTVTDSEGSTRTKSYNLGYKTDWSYRSNVTVNPDNSLTKTTASSSWNAGGSSGNKLGAGVDGWIEIVANNVNGGTYAFGLSQAKESLALSSIGYGFYITSSGTISVYEGGSNKGQIGTLSVGDILRVGREGGTIKYFHNGRIVRSVTATTEPLLIDASMYSGTIPAVVASFYLPQSSRTLFAIAHGDWHITSTWSETEGGSPALTYPGESDIVYVKGFTVDVSTSGSCSQLNITVTNNATCVKIDGELAGLRVLNNVIIKGSNTNDGSPGLVVQNNGQISVQTN